MLVFSTKLPLKEEITPENCVQLFKEWVEGSPHYSINVRSYEEKSREDFECRDGNVTFSIRHFENDHVNVVACRLENQDGNALWINDCIYISENGLKFILIQLNCNRTDFGIRLPKVHKPYIVRKFIEMGFCKDDSGIPITDYPLDADNEFYDICVKIMLGDYDYSLPAVYVSCDPYGKHRVDSRELARKLGGLAHVFLEQKPETASKLRFDTNGNNSYFGYVGIYFPGTSSCKKYGFEYYDDNREMIQGIIDSVWRPLINRLDATTYNWNQIVALQSRKKMLEWQDINKHDKKQLEEYINTFDQENKGLRDKIDELNQLVYSLEARCDSLHEALKGSSSDSNFFKSGTEPALYPSEKEDLLYSILSQVRNRFPASSRAVGIIDSLLEANPRSGNCEKIIAGVEDIFANRTRLNDSAKSQLKSLGFTISDEGAHYKLIFHDPRYTFSVAKTPSDHRGGNNLTSDIRKIIDIERKII